MQATKIGADVVSQGKAPTVMVYTDAGGNQALQIPTTRSEMQVLLARRQQIQEQLKDVSYRRRDLVQQLRSVPDEAKPGLQAQLQVLNTRAVQLENDLGTLGREIAAASPQLIQMAYEPVGPSGPPRGADKFDDGMGAGAAIMFVAMSAVYFFSWRRWKRKAFKSPSVLPSADSERLQRLEHGLEAVAIEVERISEGQRFVTKLLSESQSARTPERVG